MVALRFPLARSQQEVPSKDTHCGQRSQPEQTFKGWGKPIRRANNPPDPLTEDAHHKKANLQKKLPFIFGGSLQLARIPSLAPVNLLRSFSFSEGTQKGQKVDLLRGPLPLYAQLLFSKLVLALWEVVVSIRPGSPGMFS